MRHLHIIGHGAIGSMLHGYAILNNLSVSTTVRNNASTVRRVKTLDNKFVELATPVTETFDIPEDAIIVLPLKAYQVEPALENLSSRLKSGHTLVLLHNGIINVSTLKEYTASCSIFSATTSHAAKKTKDCAVVTGLGSTFLGVASTQKSECELREELNSVEAILNLLIPTATYERDINHVLWTKLAINAVINPLTAIHGVKNGVLANDEFNQTINALINEIVYVANATGVHFTTQQVSEWVYGVIEQTAENYSSMHQDIVYKRRTEIDFINGHIVDIANKKGIDVSVNASMVEQVKQLSNIAD